MAADTIAGRLYSVLLIGCKTARRMTERRAVAMAGRGGNASVDLRWRESADHILGAYSGWLPDER
jgi:hypothetical protein